MEARTLVVQFLPKLADSFFPSAQGALRAIVSQSQRSAPAILEDDNRTEILSCFRYQIGEQRENDPANWLAPKGDIKIGERTRGSGHACGR
jgi:hypothetical protein